MARLAVLVALSHLPPGSCHFGVVGAAGTELQDLYYWPVGNIHPNNLYAKVDVSEDFSSIVLCTEPLRDMTLVRPLNVSMKRLLSSYRHHMERLFVEYARNNDTQVII